MATAKKTLSVAQAIQLLESNIENAIVIDTEKKPNPFQYGEPGKTVTVYGLALRDTAGQIYPAKAEFIDVIVAVGVSKFTAPVVKPDGTKDKEQS